MAARKMTNKLLNKSDINKELRLISGTSRDYITKDGEVYSKLNDKFFKKTNFINKNNGYLYVSLQSESGKKIQRRVHRLVAEAYIPNPENFRVVMHIDNNKQNPNVNNLKWGSVSENTKNAYNDGLEINDKGFDDSQSIPVILLDENNNIINLFGSISIASKETGMTKSSISYQCNGKIKSKPRSGKYFMFYNDYINSEIIL